MGSALFSGTKTLNAQGDMVKRFLTRRIARPRAAIIDVFATSDGKRKDGPDAPAVLKILADFAGVSEEIDRRGDTLYRPRRTGECRRRRASDRLVQSQGLLKGEVNAEELVGRAATTTPAKAK